ncbi:MAG: GAF domain-containing protein [Pseudanabaenaceae cyanobacterium bins.39]|nr:GAF domain-containing protein [Pseudanabaenaceae cyanobacterium bins.39]
MTGELNSKKSDKNKSQKKNKYKFTQKPDKSAQGAKSNSAIGKRVKSARLTQDSDSDIAETITVAQQKALFGVIAKIRQSLDLDSIFNSTAIEVRQLLNADRVGIYRFNENSEFHAGEFVSEALLPQFKSALAVKIEDHCFSENYANYYQQGKVWSCADIYQQDLSVGHVKILEQFQVRANLVVPLLIADRPWGLLCIHQCSAPRQWLEMEIDFVKMIATHLEVAIQQAEYVAQLQAQSNTLAVEQAVEMEKAVAVVINKIRRSLDLDTIFATTTAEVRQLLKTDRVVIYRFNPDWSGEFIVESLTEDCPSLIEAQNEYSEIKTQVSECTLKKLANLTATDTYLQVTQGEGFFGDRAYRACADIYAAGFTPCYIKALEHYQSRAYAIAAIYKGTKLWGLLAAQSQSVRQWQDTEINFLLQIGTQLGVAIQQGELFEQVQKRSTDLQTTLEIELQKRSAQLARETEQERALARVIERIRQTLDIASIFSATTLEVRQNLDCDRVVVYRFFDDWSGEFVFESKKDEWLPLEELADRNKVWQDTYLQEYKGGRYLNHESFVINDIYTANLTECHVQILESYQVRAFMIAPVFVADKLWGLLAAYQNSGSRIWETSEIRLLTQVGYQLGVAYQQAELLVQLQKAKEGADAASKAKSDFLAHMSHELRTPLNSVLGFAQVLMRDDLLTPQQREHVGIITRSGEHLLTLLNDVLEMSKIESGMIELNPKTLNFHILLARLKDMFTLKAQIKNLQLTFEKDPEVPKYIYADESKIRQILINIIGNAVKFTDKGSVNLQVTYQNNYQNNQNNSDNPEMKKYCNIFFEVTDTGVGIAPEELGILFDPFVQTSSGRQSQEGTGLGMSISKRFIELMDGNIHVESAVNQGTVVRFNIQVQIASPRDLPIPLNRGEIALSQNTSSYRILLVDDKYESRFLMKSLLTPIGFEIREATNGQEAIEVWRSWQPHLIWMDMQMPVMDGYSATRIIRDSESPEAHCKIIALTASAFDAQRSAMLNLGCDDFVSKPIRENIIFEKIAEHLGIGYEYVETETEDAKISKDASDLQQLIHQDLASLDVLWLEKMQLAARAADEDAIFLLLELIQDTHPATAKFIHDLVNNFHLDQIIKIIQPFIDQNHAN